MPIIPIESASVGMKLDKDIFSGKGIKLAIRGTVLTENQIRLLINNDIRIIEVLGEGETDAGPEMPEVSPDERKILIQILQRTPIFEKLSPEHLELLMSHFTTAKYDARTLLFSQGDPGDCFFIVLKGSIKIFIKNKKREKEKILAVCRAGDSFGELSLIDGKPRSASAKTLQKTELLVISQNSFMQLLKKHFEIAQGIMHELIERIFETHQHMTDLTAFDIRTRVIKNLIKLANVFGRRSHHAIDVEFPLDLTELAQMVGIELWELHDVLTEFERIELVQMHAHHFVLNLDKLRSFT